MASQKPIEQVVAEWQQRVRQAQEEYFSAELTFLSLKGQPEQQHAQEDVVAKHERWMKLLQGDDPEIPQGYHVVDPWRT